MAGVEIMNEIVALLVGALVGIGEGIGEGLSSMATSVFLTTTGDTQALSVFGSLVVIFAGISLAFGLTRWVVNFISSLGARNR